MNNNNPNKHPVDLEIRIFASDELAAGYPVEITLGGQQEFPRGHLSTDVLPWTSSGDSASDGQQLLNTLLADSALRSAWAETRGQASQRRIRLRIDTAAAELHALPWEALQEEADATRPSVMLSAQVDTPFSRYLPIALPWGGPVEERPIRALVIISNPDDIESKYNLSPVDVETEQANLKSTFEAIGPDVLQVDFLQAPITPERLENKLREGDGYHILHYLGHGAFSARRGQAVLYLQDDDGNARLLPDHELSSLLARQGIQPRLVFLAACQSATRSTNDAFLGMAPRLVSVGVPAVIAMQDFVSIESALKFGTTFYQRLLEHGQVDQAVNEARSTLLTAGRPDAAVPVLFMRLKSGQLWGAEADARGQVLGAKNPRIFWKALIKNIQTGKCTPIVGPRVRGRWIPAPSEIACAWADEYEYPFSDQHDLTRVLEYISVSQGEDYPRYELLDTMKQMFNERLSKGLRADEEFDTLSELVQAIGWEELTADDPNEVHKMLARLDLPLYLTTNYDNFLTAALSAQEKQPEREICGWNEMLDGLPSLFEDDPEYEPTPEAPLVYHLFGSEDEPDAMVLTEDDHLDFLVNISSEMERIPNYIWAALANSSLMFLGYGLNDWGFRVIMRGLVATRQRRRRIKHIGVQLDPRDVSVLDVEAAKVFLQQYFQNAEINVFSGSLEQFMAELREWWEEEAAR
ncbi:MAG: CHAT domain-containing protein [Chloroflexi bacterium]|nr:CHAT domain-containing protein [Chloroflexota bacterium]